MIRRVFVLTLVLLLPAIALAKRQQVVAKSATVLRDSAADTAKEVAKVAAGDKLTVLSTKGEWANVATAAGKKGWVPLKVVPDAKTTAAVSTGTSSTTVAAAEGSTSAAMRGRPGFAKTRTIVVGEADAVKQVGDALRANAKLEVLDADYVIMVKKAADGSLTYEVSDVKAGTTSAAKAAKSADEVATDVGAIAVPAPTP